MSCEVNAHLGKRCETLKNGTRVDLGAAERINLDSLLLASFSGLRNGRLLDLGAGCGILLLWLHDRGFSGEAVTVEQNPDAVSALRRSVACGKIVDFDIVEGDLRQYAASAKFDAVISNPPFYDTAAGAVSNDARRAEARSAVSADFADVASAAARNLKERGRFLFCYPALRLQRALAVLQDTGFSAKRLRLCRHSPDKEPWLVLVEARFHGGEGLTIEPDFLVERGGAPTGEYRAITAERTAKG